MKNEKPKIRTIEIDVDGVIYDIWSTFFKDNRFKYAEEANRLNFTIHNFKDYSLSGLNTEQRALAISAFSDVEFMTHIQVNSSVPDSICLLKNMFDYKQIDCVVINTLVNTEEIAYLRKWQLTELFAVLKQYNFLISTFVKTEKADFGCDLLIEDNSDAIEKTLYRHKMNALIDAPYNWHCTCSAVNRFTNLYDVLKYVNMQSLE